MMLKAFAFFMVLLVFAGCGGGGSSETSAIAPTSPTQERISYNGGRVAWYTTGLSNHELIAYDAVVDPNPLLKYTEVFTMQPDGSSVFDVTGPNTDVPGGFVGQPAWHPDGQHIVLQVENGNSQHTRYNHVSWGINNDLWIIKKDGTGAEKIWDTPLNHAALHPHFNANGTKLIFAERIATGVDLGFPTPGGENPWAGWQIHIVDFDISATGTNKLSNHIILTDIDFVGGQVLNPGFFETHGFVDQSTIIFSHTDNGDNYVDDIFTAHLDGSNVQNLIQSPTTWDEHGSFSPSGENLAFVSSRVDPDWQAPVDDASTLRTELYLQDQLFAVTQITDFNASGDNDKRYLVSDFEWDWTGSRIVLQVAPVDKVSGSPDPPEIWIITFPESQ